MAYMKPATVVALICDHQLARLGAYFLRSLFGPALASVSNLVCTPSESRVTPFTVDGQVVPPHLIMNELRNPCL
jgi:hypothetical protein